MPHEPDAQRKRHLRLVLDEHERERSDLAHELHEQVAQALAVALLGLDGLASGHGFEDSASRIAAVRAQVAETLEHCRALAVALRPPLLDQLGLVPALERLAERAGVERSSVDPALADAGLSPALQTDVYRSVETALALVSGNRSLTVSLNPALREVRMSVRSLDADARIGAPGALELRLGLSGGTLTASGGELAIRIPIDPGAEGAIAAFPQPRRVEIPDDMRSPLP